MKKIILLALLFSFSLLAQTGDEFAKYCNVLVDSKDICTNLIVTANPLSSTICQNVELHLADLNLGNEVGEETVRLQWKIKMSESKLIIGSSQTVGINEFVFAQQDNITIVCR